MGDIRALHWAWMVEQVRAGNVGPLATELRRPNCGEVPADVRVLLADLAEGRRPRGRPGNKPRGDAEAVRFVYIAERAAGMAHAAALWLAMDCCRIERSTVYRLLSRRDRARGDLFDRPTKAT
jgi:hypothetical protein